MPSRRLIVQQSGVRGPAGDPGNPGAPGAAGGIQSIVPGANVSVNNADPAHPVVSATGGAGGVDTATIHAATSKTTPVDADETLLLDSAASFGLKRLTWANIKAALAAAVQTLTNKDLTSGTNTFPTFNQNTTGSAAKLTTARNIDGQPFDGTAAVTVIAPGTHAASSKTTPVDADEFPIVDSAASNVLKKLTFANLRTWVTAQLQDELDNKLDVTAIEDETLNVFEGLTVTVTYDSVGGAWPTLDPVLAADTRVSWVFKFGDESHPPPTTMASGDGTWRRRVTS